MPFVYLMLIRDVGYYGYRFFFIMQLFIYIRICHFIFIFLLYTYFVLNGLFLYLVSDTSVHLYVNLAVRLFIASQGDASLTVHLDIHVARRGGEKGDRLV